MSLPSWRTAVLKIGSSLIAPAGESLRPSRLQAIAQWINAERAEGRQLVLVSSGAVACGRARMSGDAAEKPRTLTRKQALAAIGQSTLMQAWQAQIDTPVAQLLITRADLADHRRRAYFRRTLRELLQLGVLPVINENDSVAIDELRLGDNDTLAAHVAVLLPAQLLIIGSDIDAFYSADPGLDPHAAPMAEVPEITRAIYAAAGGSRSGVGTGGMLTKIRAADLATRAGIPTLLCNGRKAEHFAALRLQKNPGTLFLAQRGAESTRHYWLSHLQSDRGRVLIDDGAEQALRTQGASLLRSGIREIHGPFRRGDTVAIANAARPDVLIARGRIRADAHDFPELNDTTRGTVIVHRNQMALIEP